MSLGPAILKTLRVGARGMRKLLQSELAAWIHLAVMAATILLGVLVGIGRDEWLWLIAAMAMVWAAEAFNTAIEKLADCITLEQDERIGAAKDIAAGGVMIVVVAALLIGALIFIPHVTASLAL